MKETTGVFHHKASAKQYDFMRQAPDPALKDYIEQYWHVTWDLGMGVDHLQQNLPDPTMHLTFEQDGIWLYGPVTSRFEVTLSGKGMISGVKFRAGALTDLLGVNSRACVDVKLPAEAVMPDVMKLVQKAARQNFPDKCQQMDAFFNQLAGRQGRSEGYFLCQNLLDYITQNPDVRQVDQLAAQFQVSVRKIQRLFYQYIGLSPKWVIRKYRMHDVLRLLEQGAVYQDIIHDLGYYDQSHFIKDFKLFTGKSPSKYLVPIRQDHSK